MKLDIAKLEAAGLRAEKCEGGVMVATSTMTQMQFVRMNGDEVVLAPARSSLHRAINSALGGNNPVMPGSGS